MRILSYTWLLLLSAVLLTARVYAIGCETIGGTGVDCQQTIKTTVVDVTGVKVEMQQPMVQAQIKSWDGRVRKWNNYRGADVPVTATMSQDSEELIGPRFVTCQDVPHTYEQILTPAITSSSACVTYYRYAGASSGVCWKSVPCGMPCGCCWIIADVVDYYFPSYKINASEQLYQSAYLEKAFVEEAIPVNETIYPGAGAMAVEDMNLAAQSVANTMRVADPGGAYTGPAISAANAPNPALLEKALMDPAMRDLRHTAPSQEHIYTRNIFEPTNQMTQGLWSIPHVPKTHMFASDMPSGFWFSRFASMGASVLPIKNEAFYQMVMGQYTCVRSGQMSMKTPLYIANLGGTSPFPMKAISTAPVDTVDLCLKNVGQRYNLQSSGGGLLHITDRMWRGAAKDLDLFLGLFLDPGNIGSTAIHYGAERHTFLESADKFLALRSNEFKLEHPMCRPISDMTKVNRDYFKVNTKNAMTGGEATVEVFPHYVGCWGFKGMDLDFWTGPCGGGVYYAGVFSTSPLARDKDIKTSPLRLH